MLPKSAESLRDGLLTIVLIGDPSGDKNLGQDWNHAWATGTVPIKQDGLSPKTRGTVTCTGTDPSGDMRETKPPRKLPRKVPRKLSPMLPFTAAS